MKDIPAEKLLDFIDEYLDMYEEFHEHAIEEFEAEQNDPDGSMFSLNMAKEDVTRWGNRIMAAGNIKRWVIQEAKHPNGKVR